MSAAKPRVRGSADTRGVRARQIAGRVLSRVEQDDAYANLVLRHELAAAELEQIDSRLVTDLVYGTLRRQRSCDHLLGRFLVGEPPAAARVFLRLGAYQLAFRPDIPGYAAVSTTVSAAPKRFRPLCNAVLRKVAAAPVAFASPGDELSYPDWIIDRLSADLGPERARAALAAMNEPAAQVRREDGYSQDRASQMVVELLDARPGEIVADLCAAPGGKATGIAATGAFVVACELSPARLGLLVDNAARYGRGAVAVCAGDALRPPLRPGSLDRILLDAPCSGLGVLRRRPDARWRLDSGAPERLADLQRRMISAAATLLRPGGTLLYSVCTLTAVESTGVDQYVESALPELVPEDVVAGPWERLGRGAVLLPQTEGTDGMCVFRYRYSP